MTTIRHRASGAVVGLPHRFAGNISVDQIGWIEGWHLMDNAYSKSTRLVGPGKVDLHVNEWFGPAELQEQDRWNKL